MKEPDRYLDHQDPAIRLLSRISDGMELFSIEHDILTCAILHLEDERPSDRLPGGTVKLWWSAQDGDEAAREHLKRMYDEPLERAKQRRRNRAN